MALRSPTRTSLPTLAAPCALASLRSWRMEELTRSSIISRVTENRVCKDTDWRSIASPVSNLTRFASVMARMTVSATTTTSTKASTGNSRRTRKE